MDLTLKPAPPFRLDLTAWALRRLPINAMDRWQDRTYSRVMLAGRTPVSLHVVQTGPPEEPVLRVTAGGRTSAARRSTVSAFLGRVLGLDSDLTPFYRLARQDERLNSLAQRFVGFRPPRLPSVFEALVNGIACQQLSLNVGIQLLNRLCVAYAPASGAQYAFPRPQDLAAARPAGLKRLGFSGAKAMAILQISRAISRGTLDLQSLARLDNAAAIDRLQQLKGIGRWTAEYLLLRGLGRLDVFPAGDVGGQNKLQRWLQLKMRPADRDVNRILRRWSPYQGLIYFHLLLDEQSRRGLLNPSADTPPAASSVTIT